MLITIYEFTVLEENEVADKLILKELFKDGYYFTWLLLKINLYDNENDKLCVGSFILVSLF